MDGQIVRCPACGKSNRVPALAGGKRAVCGNCKAPLEAGGQPVTLSDSDFADRIRQGDFVVDFWAAWCGPCRVIAPVVDELAAARPDIVFGKLNVDENPRTAAQYSARSIPLLVFFRDGAETGRIVGAVPRTQIEAGLRRYLP